MIAPRNKRLAQMDVQLPAPRTEAAPRQQSDEMKEALARTIRNTSEQRNQGETFDWQAGCTI